MVPHFIHEMSSTTGWWSDMLHGLPHVDSRLYPVPDYYIHQDRAYESGVRSLGYIPVAIIILLLFILLVKLAVQISFLPKNSILEAYCNCLKQRWLDRLLKICLVVLLLCILLEIIILIVGLHAHKKYYLTTDYIDNHSYGERLELLEPEKRPGLAFDNSKYGLSSLLNRTDVVKNRTVRPYKKLFAKFLTELQGVWVNIMRPDVEPREIETPFMKDLMQYTITRFIKCMIGWITGIGILICKPHRYWMVAVVGVIWCCIASNWLMRAAVKVSDICQNPDFFVAGFQNRKQLREFLLVNQYYLCEQFLHVCAKNKNRIRNIYYKWGLVLNKTMHKIMAEYDLVQKPDYKNDYRYAYMASVCDFTKNQTDHYVTQLNQRFVKCRGKQPIEEDMPEDNINSLCDNDAVVRLLVYQMILVVILAMLFLIMILIHLSRPESIFACRRALIIYRAKTKKAIKDSITWILEEKRLYPPMMPPHECYKTCRHYRKAMLATGKEKVEDEEDDIYEPVEQDPFKKKLPPLMPPCAIRRRVPCCEPLEQDDGTPRVLKKCIPMPTPPC